MSAQAHELPAVAALDPRLRAVLSATAVRGTVRAAAVLLGDDPEAVVDVLRSWSAAGHPPLRAPSDAAWDALRTAGVTPPDDPALTRLRALLRGDATELDEVLAALHGVTDPVVPPPVPGVVAERAEDVVAAAWRRGLEAAAVELWESVAAAQRRLGAAVRADQRDRAATVLDAHARVLAGLAERVRVLVERLASRPDPPSAVGPVQGTRPAAGDPGPAPVPRPGRRAPGADDTEERRVAEHPVLPLVFALLATALAVAVLLAALSGIPVP